MQSRIDLFFRNYRIGGMLRKCNFSKIKGFTCLALLKIVFALVFTGKNLYSLLHGNSEALGCAKDAVYRFINNPRFNWRKLLLLLSSRVIANDLTHLTSESREKVLIIDDSVYDRDRSKKVELLAKVYDYVDKLFKRGFRMLTLGWSDGNTFIPLCFSLLSSRNENCRINDIDSRIDKRTVGYRHRKEALRKKTDMAVDLIRQALAVGIEAQYVLFDSWFSFSKTIMEVVEQRLDVICRLKSLPSIRYTYNGKQLTLKQLYKTVKKNRRRKNLQVLASVIVTLGKTVAGEDVKAKIIFVGKRGSREWIALLSTDLQLCEEEIIRIYSKRWDIEVFFKMSKTYLKLAKEFEGRSYDMMFAHTTIVCMRYIMLALEVRNETDYRTIGPLFHALCDEMKDKTFTEAMVYIIDLLKQAMTEVLHLSEDKLHGVFEYFLLRLPSYYQRWVKLCTCES